MTAASGKLAHPARTLVHPQRRALVLQAAVVVLIAFAGVTHLAYPFGGDQALFALGARAMHDGAVLYRDFWDLKQPAIFLFYLTGASVFGFDEIGIHLFELTYFLVFSVVLQITLRPAFRYPAAGAIAPLLIVGLYYATATQLSLTQVEVLAGFPLYLCAYFALRGAQTQRAGFYAASGIAAAIVLCFKLLFFPLVLALYVPMLRKWSYRNASVLVATFAIAAIAWIGATAALAGRQIVFDTFFAYPMEISRLVPTAPIHRLAASVAGYALGALVVIVLAAIGVGRTRHNPWKTTALAWIAGALFVIVLQRQSWWQYQMDLFDVPLGILGAFGVDALCKWREEGVQRAGWRVKSIAGAVLLLLLALPALRHQAATLRDLARSGWALSAAGQQHFQALVDPHDATIAETLFLRHPTALPGDIYVCGNPRYYLAANRGQAVSINGWSMELLVPEQWSRLAQQLRAKRPAYMFVDRYYQSLIPSRSPQVAQTIARGYRLIRSSTFGAWYERR